MSPSSADSSGNRMWLILGSITSVQIGAGYALHLMDIIGPAATVMLRQGGAALVLLGITRPHLRGRSHEQWTTIAAFGLILAIMNVTFYGAVQRLPLGIAVAIELLGPLGLAGGLARKKADLIWVGVALTGVAVLSEGDGSLNPVGVILALVAAGCWAAYILVSRRAGQLSCGIDALALAMAAAAILVAPFGLQSGTALIRAHTIWLGALVALLAGLLPFSLELVALRTVPARVFGMLMSLSPVAATVSGFVLLHQRLTLRQTAAMIVVIVASFATSRNGDSHLNGGDTPATGPPIGCDRVGQPYQTTPNPNRVSITAVNFLVRWQ